MIDIKFIRFFFFPKPSYLSYSQSVTSQKNVKAAHTHKAEQWERVLCEMQEELCWI